MAGFDRNSLFSLDLKTVDMLRRLTCFLLLALFTQTAIAQTFAERQLAHERVRTAKDFKDGDLRAQFAHRQIAFPPHNVYLRAFKHEEVLEVWVQSEAGQPYQKFRDYSFCASSGYMGPKCKQGDEQIPEGFYWINHFNPHSNFHLSLGVDYPNPADRKRSRAANLGGSIYIHGACETIGCIPITDQAIEELYWLSVQAVDAGQQYIPVHIFPNRFGYSSPFLYEDQKVDGALHAFWDNLREGFDYFEQYRKPPAVHIDPDGKYWFF